MKRTLLALVLVIAILFISGCIESTGFEKRTTLCPNSISIGYSQEKYKSDAHAWDGFTISGTWVFK